MKVLSTLKRFLIGRPLKSTDLGEQKFNKKKALAILSSDALSSVAYGPEQILIVLITISTVAYWYSIPIAVGVLILLSSAYFVLSTNNICLSAWRRGIYCCKGKLRSKCWIDCRWLAFS